ncbi:kinase-like domain-containing protein [Mycena polygramma]|nr:kinase-like domain-containing protein [Mycena polygramma]
MSKLCDITKGYPPEFFLELDSVDTRQIGRGGFADIFRGRYNGRDVALKRLQVYQPEPNKAIEFSKSLLREVSTWVHLNHPNVLPFLGLDNKTFEDYPPCIVTPFMRNGTLFDFVKTQNATLPDGRLNLLLFQTAHGLAYLHAQKVVHGDLRGTNVLIDANEHAQIADFGLAIVTDATLGTTSTAGGSARWMAPELLHHETQSKRPTKASDVYAFSCLCIELYTGAPPFWGMHDAAVIVRVSKGERLPRPSGLAPPEGTRAMSGRLWETVEACSAHNPSDRPDMDSVSHLILSP